MKAILFHKRKSQNQSRVDYFVHRFSQVKLSTKGKGKASEFESVSSKRVAGFKEPVSLMCFKPSTTHDFYLNYSLH